MHGMWMDVLHTVVSTAWPYLGDSKFRTFLRFPYFLSVSVDWAILGGKMRNACGMEQNME